ncbi:MAG: hypothetical protein SF182_09590 [Deltaproteobacteria bacterium]|nr:hypothetical protein [Deltaproteobacteria bacterium]
MTGTLVWLVIALTVVTLAMNFPRYRLRRRLAQTRGDSDGFPRFRAALPEVPEDLCRSVYSGIQQLIAPHSFPIHVADDLVATLDVDLGDLHDLAESLHIDQRRTDTPAINTAGDLARAAWHARQTSGRNAHRSVRSV